MFRPARALAVAAAFAACLAVLETDAANAGPTCRLVRDETGAWLREGKPSQQELDNRLDQVAQCIRWLAIGVPF